MKRKQFIYIALSGLVFLSVVLEGCHKPKTEDQNTHSSMVYDPRVTIDVSSISDSSAVISGGITNTAYCTITDCGIYWSTTQNRIWIENKIDNIKLDNFSFRVTLTGLLPDTIYYVAVALKYTHPGSSIIGGDNSLVSSFETPPSFPVIITSAIIEYTKYSAVVGGMVTNQGSFPLIERGIYWGLSPNPDTSGTKIEMGNGLGVFSTQITGLSPNTNYYVKAYAANNNGNWYGSEKRFNTGNDTTFPNVSDVDGNTYHIVTIGNQVWMAENLKTTNYNDQSPIPPVTDNKSWSELYTPAYCWYNNDESTKLNNYGALYNWFSVNTGKLCPIGWHVPTIEDWTFLTDYLGGDSMAGGKLKETGTIHWLSPNTGATNESGFSGLPGGLRNSYDGRFFDKGSWEIWWSSSVAPTGYYGNAYDRDLTFSEGKVFKGGDSYQYGFHIRCIKD